MKIVDLLDNNKDKLTFSFEFIPPQKGMTAKDLIERVKPLMEFNPLFVDVTCHRNEIVFDNLNPDKGKFTHGFVHKKHPSTLAVCSVLRDAFGVEVMPHILCGGFTKAETEDLLLDLDFMGFDNVMALRGDKLQIEKDFKNEIGNASSLNLIDQIHNLNSGKALDTTIQDKRTDFCIAAACYPEKHISSPNIDWEYYFTLDKVKAGTDFFISQMFFDNEFFFKFVDGLRSRFFDGYVLPGIKVLSSFKQVFSIPSRFGVSVHNDLVKRLEGSSGKESYRVGVEWAVLQCKVLIERGFKHIHFFTMNSSLVCDVLSKVF